MTQQEDLDIVMAEHTKRIALLEDRLLQVERRIGERARGNLHKRVRDVLGSFVSKDGRYKNVPPATVSRDVGEPTHVVKRVLHELYQGGLVNCQPANGSFQFKRIVIEL